MNRQHSRTVKGKDRCALGVEYRRLGYREPDDARRAGMVEMFRCAPSEWVEPIEAAAAGGAVSPLDQLVMVEPRI